MAQDLRGKDGDVVTRIRLASNVEVLLCVLWELLEEKRQKSVDIFAGSDGIADAASAIGVPNVDGLIEKNDGGVRIPRVWVVNELELAVDRCRSKFKEKAGQGAASRSAVEP